MCDSKNVLMSSNSWVKPCTRAVNVSRKLVYGIQRQEQNQYHHATNFSEITSTNFNNVMLKESVLT